MPDRPDVAVEAPVLHGVVVLAKRIRAEAAAAFEPLGLHPGQDRLLSELWREDGLSQSELMRRLGVEPATVTGTVKRLERAGFVRREPDPANRRISRVFLTASGRALEEPVRRVWRDVEQGLTDPLSAQRRRQLRAALDAMTGLD